MARRRVANGDIAVLIPGILGSTLLRGDDEIWGYGAVFRRLSHLTERLTDDLSLRSPDAWTDPEAGADDGVVADGLLRTRHLLPGFWGVDGYDDLVEYLTRQFDHRDLTVFPYDWRQSNRVSAHRLKRWIEPMIAARRETTPGACAVLIGHSMGGLVARFYAEVLDHGLDGEPGRVTRRIVTIGTPYQGAVKALALLANGHTQIGPFRVDLGDLARSLPSVSELLPVYETIGPTMARLGADSREPGSVLRDELSKITTPTGLGGLPNRAWLNCVRFHEEIDGAIRTRGADPLDYRPIVEYIQPTPVWASIEPEGVRVHKPDGFEARGDGTVPRWSATPPEASGAVAYVTGKHAALQQTRGVYHQLRGVLTERVWQPPTLMAPLAVDDQLSAEAPELVEVGAPLHVVGESYEGYETLQLGVAVDGGEPMAMLFDSAQGRYRADLPGIGEPGVHRWVVAATNDQSVAVESVSDLVYVTEPD